MYKWILLLTSMTSLSAMANEIADEEEKETIEKEDFLNSFRLDMDDISIGTELNLYTDHSDATYISKYGIKTDYNEDNDLRSIAIKSGTMTLGYSSFYNSYFEDSEMFSIEHDLLSFYDFGLQVGIGLSNGYNPDVLQSNSFVGDWMVVPLLALKYSPNFLEYKGLQVSPKIRTMGFHAYMFNIEATYTF